MCPGQGSQTPGFLEPWLDLTEARSTLAAYSESSGVDLIAHGTVSDADTIRDTAIAQPLIVAASLLAWSALTEGTDAGLVGGVAGHSVGEVAALVAAGVLTADDGMRVVGERGRAMAAAAAVVDTGMSAVVGGDEDAVIERVNELGLSPANFNGGGQLVVAGELGALQELQSAPPRGSRVIPLQVAGAFHTRFMAPARDALAAAAASAAASDPALPLWTNHDGTIVTSGREAIDLLVGQVAAPVRWDLCMAGFADAGVSGIIELTPAGALTGLAKRALRGIPTVAVKTPDDLDAARELLSV